VPIRGKLISEISPADIWDLILQKAAEDAFLEFKRELLDPRKPPDELDRDKADWVADLVAFANAEGGHVIIGMEADAQERACRLRRMVGDEAKRLATSLRDLAIQHVKPAIVQLEIRDFQIAAGEWIVIAAVPPSQGKPYMSSYGNGTRFTVRADNRKREMTYDEIQNLYQQAPQLQMLRRLVLEVESINSRLDSLESEIRKTG
jgi:predicted HTH transcriptional regulator